MKIAIYKHPYAAFVSAVLRGRRGVEVSIIGNAGNHLLQKDYDCVVLPDNVDDCPTTAPQVRVDINASAQTLVRAIQSVTPKKTEETS